MAMAVEGIIGAVFKDSGFDLKAVRAVMRNLGFFNHVLLVKTNSDSLTVHPATTIQSWCSSQRVTEIFSKWRVKMDDEVLVMWSRVQTN